MHLGRKLAIAASIALVLVCCRPVSAATVNEKETDAVLRKLDEAAKNFHSTSADFEFDSVSTDPIPDTDVQKGTIYYARDSKGFRMAAHIREVNGKPIPKIYTYSGGVFKLYEKLIDQVTTFNKFSQFESYLMLGFGASGRSLEQKWEIKYLGSEVLLDGKSSVKTDKLELVAKDPAVRKIFPKITIWVDPARGVSLKQILDEGPGQYRVSVFFNIKVNQPLPDDAFTFKTDSKTNFVSR